MRFPRHTVLIAALTTAGWLVAAGTAVGKPAASADPAWAVLPSVAPIPLSPMENDTLAAAAQADRDTWSVPDIRDNRDKPVKLSEPIRIDEPVELADVIADASATSATIAPVAPATVELAAPAAKDGLATAAAAEPAAKEPPDARTVCLRATPGPLHPRNARIALKKLSRIRGSEYTLGDIADIHSPDAEQKARLSALVLGKGPALGCRLNLMRDQIGRTLDEQGVTAEAEIVYPERMILERKMQQLDLATLCDAVTQEALAKASSEGAGRAVIDDVRLSGVVCLPEGEVSHAVTFRFPRRGVGSVAFTLEIQVDGVVCHSAAGSLRLDKMIEVMKVRHAMARGQAVSADSCAPAEARVSELQDQDKVLANRDVTPGLRAKHDLQAGETLTWSDVEREMLVRRGQRVQMILEGNALQIATQGIVRNDGALGDTVEVANANSTKSCLAVVVDRHTVRAVCDGVQ